MNHSQEYAQLPPAKPELGRYFYNTIIVALILLCLLSVVLFYQINKHSTSQQNYSELLLPASSINDYQIKVPAGQTCLIVYSSDDENSPAIMQVFEEIGRASCRERV